MKKKFLSGLVSIFFILFSVSLVSASAVTITLDNGGSYTTQPALTASSTDFRYPTNSHRHWSSPGGEDNLGSIFKLNDLTTPITAIYNDNSFVFSPWTITNFPTVAGAYLGNDENNIVLRLCVKDVSFSKGLDGSGNIIPNTFSGEGGKGWPLFDQNDRSYQAGDVTASDAGPIINFGLKEIGSPLAHWTDDAVWVKVVPLAISSNTLPNGYFYYLGQTGSRTTQTRNVVPGTAAHNVEPAAVEDPSSRMNNIHKWGGPFLAEDSGSGFTANNPEAETFDLCQEFARKADGSYRMYVWWRNHLEDKYFQENQWKPFIPEGYGGYPQMIPHEIDPNLVSSSNNPKLEPYLVVSNSYNSQEPGNHYVAWGRITATFDTKAVPSMSPVLMILLLSALAIIGAKRIKV